MAYVNQFSPGVGANQEVTPNSTSASVSVNRQAKALLLVNAGNHICHVRVGTGPQTATAADLPVRANSHIIIRKADGADTVAYVSANGTTLHIQTGEGGV